MLWLRSHVLDMEVGKRIAAARRRKNWSQAKLAEAISKDQTTVSSWERGRNEPSRRDVVTIASVLGVPVEEIELAATANDIVGRTIRVPLLSWVSAGAVSDVGQLGELDPEELIAACDLPVGGEYFATDVVGDSMDRISPEGSRLLVDIGDRELVSGKPYIFSLRGETTYKLFQSLPIRRLEPYSTNPLNKTIFLFDEDWTVVGRVVRSYIDLR